jgi:hypothetical protein
MKDSITKRNWQERGRGVSWSCGVSMVSVFWVGVVDLLGLVHHLVGGCVCVCGGGEGL